MLAFTDSELSYSLITPFTTPTKHRLAWRISRGHSSIQAKNLTPHTESNLHIKMCPILQQIYFLKEPDECKQNLNPNFKPNPNDNPNNNINTIQNHNTNPNIKY